MTLTRLLLASTAITLGSLSYAQAGPLAPARTLQQSLPAPVGHVLRIQMSISDAEAALAAAQERLREAEASGGDVESARADVAAAQAELDAAMSAAAGSPETPPAAESTEPAASQTEEATPEPTEQPAAEPQTTNEPDAPAAEPEPAPAEAEAETTETQPVEPEASAPEPETPAPEADATAPEAAPAGAEAEAVEPAPETTEPAPEAGEPAPETQAPAPEASTPEQAVPEVPAASETAPEAEPQPAPEPAPEAEAEGTEPTAAAQPAETPPADQPTAEQPASAEGQTETGAASDPAASSPAETAPAEAPTAAPEQSATTTEQEEVLTLPVEDGAPVLDSAKEEPAPEADASVAPQSVETQSEPAPPPATDQDAQAPAALSAPAPEALAESGERVSAAPAPEAQTNVTIINQIDNRTIIEVDNRTIIEHDERPRLRAGASEVYYERLRGDRIREVIVRPNGVQLVTITNRWGDVLQRSRIMPDGREYVLFFANAASDGSRQAFVDPGRRLPPLRLQIPIDDYILDATDAEPTTYLDFLLEPPVERVERLYTIEEVRRSARLRDKVRRIDLDTLTFEFGKATIAEDQIGRLSDVATAMSDILDRNPAETFLIEGHTDAVGRDEANLLLSDRRAETIAVALTDMFGIPPENLVTQGYGERYLKVRTEAPERLNRRVTIRRITPLVTPIASR